MLIDPGIAAEVLRPVWQTIGNQIHELFLSHRPERIIPPGEIRPADVANEQRVACKYRVRLSPALKISHHNANAFERVAGSLQKAESSVPKSDLISIPYGVMRKPGP